MKIKQKYSKKISCTEAVDHLVKFIRECDADSLERMLEDEFGVRATYLPDTDEFLIGKQPDSPEMYAGEFGDLNDEIEEEF
jgi:hypothetical protein